MKGQYQNCKKNKVNKRNVFFQDFVWLFLFFFLLFWSPGRLVLWSPSPLVLCSLFFLFVQLFFCFVSLPVLFTLFCLFIFPLLVFLFYLFVVSVFMRFSMFPSFIFIRCIFSFVCCFLCSGFLFFHVLCACFLFIITCFTFFGLF